MQVAHDSKNTDSALNVEVRGEFKTDITGSIGVLLLHGFTSALAAVDGFVPTLETQNIPYEMPALRGHNTKPEDLKGVTADDWYDDAFDALKKLCDRVDHVIVVGLSMGGLVALNLCARKHSLRDKICGCITWAPALGFCNPLSWLAKPLSLFIPTWRGQESFNDPECRKNNKNYATFPTKAFCELYDFAASTRKILGDVKVPLCIIQSKLDQVVPYRMSKLLFDQAGSSYIERHSLTKSGHELGQDCEADHVFQLSLQFILRFSGNPE